jgi:hypothetical protein
MDHQIKILCIYIYIFTSIKNENKVMSVFLLGKNKNSFKSSTQLTILDLNLKYTNKIQPFYYNNTGCYKTIKFQFIEKTTTLLNECLNYFFE